MTQSLDLPDPVADLRADLERAVDGTVRFDAASRAMWSADASNYRRVPIGVVRPRDVADVEAALSVCRAHDVPVLPVGARTSIAGQAVNTAVVLDFMPVNRILVIDPDAVTARVEPGVVCDAVRDAAAPHGLTFGPDPSTHNRCTLGGMIGNNACGSHSVAWGKTVDNVVGLDVLTYRGERLSLTADGTGPIPAALRALSQRRDASLIKELTTQGAVRGPLPQGFCLQLNRPSVASSSSPPASEVLRRRRRRPPDRGP